MIQVSLEVCDKYNAHFDSSILTGVIPMSPSLCCSKDRYHTGKSGFHQDNKQRLVQSTAINNGYYICYHYWYYLRKNSLSTAYLHSTGLFTAQVSKLGITPPHTHTHTHSPNPHPYTALAHNLPGNGFNCHQSDPRSDEYCNKPIGNMAIN